jgi:hypothetical protein
MPPILEILHINVATVQVKITSNCVIKSAEEERSGRVSASYVWRVVSKKLLMLASLKE